MTRANPPQKLEVAVHVNRVTVTDTDCQKDALAAVTHVPSSGLLRLPPVEPLAIASHLQKHAASAREAGSVSRNPWPKYGPDWCAHGKYSEYPASTLVPRPDY